MKIQYKRMICAIIAMFILVSGMCLEIPQADSLLVRAEHSMTSAYICSNKGNLSQYELSSRETLGVRSMVYISEISRRPVLRTILKFSTFLFSVEYILQKISNLQKSIETVTAPETRYATELLSYIHQQDGKK